MDATKKPSDGTFRQQRLKAWQPLLTPPYVSCTFFFVFIAFVIIGNVILSASRSVVEVKARYDHLPECRNGSCSVPLHITQDMKAPVFLYYELTNFNQNHRRYVKSRADSQLRGIDVYNGLSACDPLITYNSTTLYPCGLIANSYFNDSFAGYYCKNNQPNCTKLGDNEWTEVDIAWDSDKEVKFKLPSTPVQTSKGPGGFQLPNVTNEHFIVWMRTSGLPVFKKLYARLPTLTLNAGDVLNVSVVNVFPVSAFSGEKAIIISTTSWIGGKNDFLGYAYIVIGAICGFLAVAFALKHYFKPRKLGDMKYFNWRKPVSYGAVSSPTSPKNK